jgi:hypothetical protein
MKEGFYKFEPNTVCRKYTELAHMASVTNPISQPGLEFSPN